MIDMVDKADMEVINLCTLCITITQVNITHYASNYTHYFEVTLHYVGHKA